MSDTVQVACKINTSNASAQLGLEIRLDGNQLFDCEHIKEEINFTYILNDDEDGKHQLEFIMKNKTSSDTIVDADGNIISDARLIISDLEFDEIKLNQVFIDLAVYTHDFNGTGQYVEEKFYGEMGCNGSVNLKFTTPIYLWLLETM